MHSLAEEEPGEGGPGPTHERLVEHTAWLRALARRLVVDPNAADDLAQEACSAALERPRAASPSRAWLAAVLQNLLRHRRRGDARRAERERCTARAEALPGTAEVVERAAICNELAQAVMELPEPFRATVLMRFFDDLPQREIARRTGVPVATVNSRLQRGLARLRARMDAAHGGDRAAWSAALVVLVAGQGPGPNLARIPLLGAALVKTQVKVALATVALVLALAGWAGVAWMRTDAPADPAAATPAAAGGDPTVAAEVERVAPDGGGARAELPGEARDAEATAAPSTAATGTVYGASASPLAGIEVGFFPSDGADGDWRATSGPDGRFELRVPPAPGRIRAIDPAWATLRVGLFEPGALAPVVVVAPRARFTGEVRDDSGRAVEGARVELRLPDGFDRRFRAVLDASRPALRAAATGLDGDFELSNAFLVDGAELVTIHHAFAPDRRSAPVVPEAHLSITLAAPPVGTTTLEGEVRAPSGLPVAGAWVTLGGRTVATDRDGGFRFELGEPEPARRIVALAPGHLPGVFEPSATGPWPRFVTVLLGGEPLEVSGRVVDAGGAPRAGVRVWVDDPERFGRVGEDDALVEFLLGGGVTDEELEARFLDEDDELDVEAFLAARQELASPGWGWVATGGDGRFTLRGLQPRSYRVALFDPATLARAVHGPVAAGSHELSLELAHELAPLAGTVCFADGTPAAGARVGTLRRAMRIERDDGSSTSYDADGPAATVNDDGTFELGPVARDGLRLVVSGEGLRTRAARLETLGDPPRLVAERLDEPARAHVRVELGDAEWADAFALLDAGGEPVQLLRTRGTERRSARSAELVDGLSEALGVVATARWIAFYRDGAEVERYGLELQAGELNLLRY